MFARIAFAIPFGAVVTAGLLFMMHLFIATGEGETDATAARIVDFVRITRTETAQPRTERPDPPQPAEPAPEMPAPDSGTEFGNELRIALAGPEVSFNADLGGTGFGGSDGEYLPLVKVAPVYPPRALSRRLEGYVIVEFVVTSSGAVADVIVVESTSEIFERAAIEAALRFKYKPRVVDGNPIAVAGVMNKITFKLDA